MLASGPDGGHGATAAAEAAEGGARPGQGGAARAAQRGGAVGAARAEPAAGAGAVQHGTHKGTGDRNPPFSLTLSYPARHTYRVAAIIDPSCVDYIATGTMSRVWVGFGSNCNYWLNPDSAP